MTTATSIPDLYARVKAACPEACPPQVSVVGGIFQLAIECTDVGHCASWSWATDATMPVVESLILASCVRWLADNGHQPICIEKNNSNRTPSHYPQYLPKHFVVEIMDTPIYQQTFSDNLAIAALLAVEAVCEERSHV